MGRRKYLTKEQINPEHILYAHSVRDKVALCFDTGEEKMTILRFAELIELLPADDFVIVRRGTVLRKKAIVSISNDGVYTMLDGRTCQGLKRSMVPHKKLRSELGLGGTLQPPQPAGERDRITRLPLTLLEKCSLIEDMPVAYCIIEIVFDEKGHGIDFIFRYCNKQMAVVEGVPVEDMVNHSFYEVFKNGDRKWLVAYADVALNGVSHTLRDYSPEIDKNLTIHCYQPEPGYCSCVLLAEDEA